MGSSHSSERNSLRGNSYVRTGLERNGSVRNGLRSNGIESSRLENSGLERNGLERNGLECHGLESQDPESHGIVRKRKRDSSTGPNPASFRTPSHQTGVQIPDTSGTPQSTTDRSQSIGSPRKKAKVHAALSPETTSFLSDEKNWLPIGSLLYPRARLVSDLELRERPQEDVDISVSDWDLITELSDGLRQRLVDLTAARWIKASAAITRHNIRVLLLPDDVGKKHVDRSRQHDKLARYRREVLSALDVSEEAWRGHPVQTSFRTPFDFWATADDHSSFYMFNTMPSPNPDPSKIRNRYNREAMSNLMAGAGAVRGLKSNLYKYQRRSAAEMLRREISAGLQLDPRLEERQGPTGARFFYAPSSISFCRDSRQYDACRGGILAETMGLGKTVICLSLILSTIDHFPRIPREYESTQRKAEEVSSLADMAAATATHHSVPWRSHFEETEASTGMCLSSCAKTLRDNAPRYCINPEPVRGLRKSSLAPPRELQLCSTTIVVVPRNLLRQWENEIDKHVDKKCLNLLVMNDQNIPLPAAAILKTYDVILFSKERFEFEICDGSDPDALFYQRENRMSVSGVYESPLKGLHFLRIIIDEGHCLASSNTKAALVAEEIVLAERRWVVTGTPAQDLWGVEIELGDYTDRTVDRQENRRRSLEQRKYFSAREESTGPVKNLGSLASHFLKIQPWSSLSRTEAPANWDRCIYRHEDFNKRTYSGFSLCLRKVLESMVLKTRPEDVERDFELPPLTQRVIRLEPSFYDILTVNIFILVLTSNAVTSERTDKDYLFHKDNRDSRTRLVNNLRQSFFFWTGFSIHDVHAALRHGSQYLQEHEDCNPSDRALLESAMKSAEPVLSSSGWSALSSSHEIGVFVEDWPENSHQWALSDETNQVLVGATQLLQAQDYINDRLDYGLPDPTEGFGPAGTTALETQHRHGNGNMSQNDESQPMNNMGIPESGIEAEPPASKRSSLPSKLKVKPRKQKTAKKSDATEQDRDNNPDEAPESSSATAIAPRPSAAEMGFEALQKPSVVGTTSAKLSYLLNQIITFQDEKIIIFYEGTNIAYYIAQALELLDVKHLIYAKGISVQMRNSYIEWFDKDPSFHVMLMDVKEAAHGLNLTSASRVYFVNPAYRPNIEAQAIKRAHRIGQTRPVVVETLLLKGTIEEAMFERAKTMTRHEHKDAKSLEDDQKIAGIIQKARPLLVRTEDGRGYEQLARIERPQQLFGRVTRGAAKFSKRELRMDGGVLVAEEASRQRATRSRRQNVDSAANADANESGGGMEVEAEAARPTMEEPISLLTDDEDTKEAVNSPPRDGSESVVFVRPTTLERTSIFGDSERRSTTGESEPVRRVIPAGFYNARMSADTEGRSSTVESDPIRRWIPATFYNARMSSDSERRSTTSESEQLRRVLPLGFHSPTRSRNSETRSLSKENDAAWNPINRQRHGLSLSAARV